MLIIWLKMRLGCRWPRNVVAHSYPAFAIQSLHKISMHSSIHSLPSWGACIPIEAARIQCTALGICSWQPCKRYGKRTANAEPRQLCLRSCSRLLGPSSFRPGCSSTFAVISLQSCLPVSGMFRRDFIVNNMSPEYKSHAHTRQLPSKKSISSLLPT